MVTNHTVHTAWCELGIKNIAQHGFDGVLCTLLLLPVVKLCVHYSF